MNCPTGKIAYSDRRDAQGAANSLHRREGSDVHAYVCPDCGGWHIGHLPGTKTKARSPGRALRRNRRFQR